MRRQLILAALAAVALTPSLASAQARQGGGYYDGGAFWIPGGAAYDGDGRLVGRPPSGYYEDNGVWVREPARTIGSNLGRAAPSAADAAADVAYSGAGPDSKAPGRTEAPGRLANPTPEERK